MRTLNDFIYFVKAEFSVIGVNLKIFSAIINQFPFWILENGLEQFEDQHQAYQNLHEQINVMLRAPDNYQRPDFIRILDALKQLRQRIITYLISSIDRLQDSIIHQPSLNKIRILQQALQNFSDFISELYILPITEDQLNRLLQLRQNFEEAFTQLETEIAQFKKILIANFNPKHLHQENGLLRRNFARETLNNAMQIYYEAYAIKETLKQFSSLKNNFYCFEISINTYLAKESYDDFILIIHLHKPEQLDNILHQYKNIFQFKLKQTKKQATFLKRRFGLELFAAIRLQRIINIYHLWEKYLSTNQNARATNNDLMHFLQLHRLFTYEKKAIFKQGFANQFLYIVLQDLNTFIQKPANINENNMSILLAGLKSKREKICTRARNLEQQLQSHYQNMQKILFSTFSSIVLGALQHPEYQLGRFTSEFMDHSTQYSSIPVLNETLPPALKNILGHASGFTVLLMSLIFSRRIGYSYQLIATITRIPLSHIDALFCLGKWLDSIGQYIDHKFLIPLEDMSPQQLTGLLEQYRNLIRWDELGVIEKDTLLQWITGLGIHFMLTMLSGQWLIPALTGYGVATVCREIAGWVTKNIAQKYGFSQETNTFAQVIAHLTTYTYTYPYGFKLGAWFSRPRQQSTDLSYAEALTIFGLPNSATSTEIKKRFHELGLQYHPDKCRTEQCAKQMVQIDRAYETLKMQ